MATTTQTVQSDKPFKLNANTFTKTGYDFVGWNTKADGTGQDYEDEEQVAFSSDMTLYAQWEKSTYNVIFDVRGGQMQFQQDNVNIGTGYATFTYVYDEPIGSKFRYGDNTLRMPYIVESPDTGWNGSWNSFNFIDWRDALVDGNEITANTKVTQDMTCYATWQGTEGCDVIGSIEVVSLPPNEIVSGFSPGNYIETKGKIDFNNTDFEIVVCFQTPNNVDDLIKNQEIFSMGGSMEVAIVGDRKKNPILLGKCLRLETFMMMKNMEEHWVHLISYPIHGILYGQ